MASEPHINDFLALIDWHLGNALKRAQKAIAQVLRDAARGGALNSGRIVFSLAEAARSEFESGIDKVLGETRRVGRITKLDPADLRQMAAQRLVDFNARIKAEVVQRVTSAAPVKTHKELAEFDQYLTFALRQFDVGFATPPDPEIPPVANSIVIGSMHASTIQQGSPGATQHSEIRIDSEGALAAIRSIEKELNIQRIETRMRDELSADIATIRAQLSKPTPSRTIVHEAMRSIRSVAEGIAGGVLTSPFLSALTALGTAIGFH